MTDIPPEVMADAQQDVVHTDDGATRGGQSVKTHLRDSEAAFNLGVLPNEQQEKATERRCDVCQVVNVHELSNCAGCGHELQPLRTGTNLMGMFDTIQCDKPLPGDPKPPPHAWLQSKDFDCGLEVYTITADDKLLGPAGEALLFHGFLNFYTYEGDTWFEYEAKFTDGRLVEICPVSIYLNGVGGPQTVYYPPMSDT